MTHAEHFRACQIAVSLRAAAALETNAVFDTILLSRDDARLLARYRNGGRRHLGAFGKFRFESREVRMSDKVSSGVVCFE